MGLQVETILVHGNAHQVGNFLRIFGGHQGGRKHQQIKRNLLHLAQQRLIDLYHPVLHHRRPVHIVNVVVNALAARIPERPLVVGAIHLNVAIEDMDVGLGIELFDVQGILDGRLAADPRTIGALGGSGAHTLDHDHPFGVEGAVPKLLFQFNLGDHILPVVPIQSFGSERQRSGGNDNAAHRFRLQLTTLVANGHLVIANHPAHRRHFTLQQRLGPWLGLKFRHQRAHQLGSLFAARANAVDPTQQAAKLCLPFHQDHFHPHVRQRPGGRQPGHPAANDYRPAHQGRLDVLRRFEEPGLGHRHPDQVFGLHHGQVPILRVNPGTLIPDVGHLEQILIQPRLGARALEERHMGARRTGRHHDAGEPMFLDGIHDLGNARFGTGIEVVLGKNHVGQPGRILGQARAIQ